MGGKRATMDKVMPALDFRVMALSFKLRDFWSPRMNVLREFCIKPVFHVLDYGCGPGSYLPALVQLVGDSGQIYALDIHPLAIQQVQNIIARRGFTSIKTILSDSYTGLAEGSIDAVLLYDILHGLSEPDRVLAELHRILKPEGILSSNDHHLQADEIITRITSRGLFRLAVKGRKVFNFAREERKA